jgi:lipoprotein-anchoring transpeptidase ErfK/SrfK
MNNSNPPFSTSRRSFLHLTAGASALLVAGCQTTPKSKEPKIDRKAPFPETPPEPFVADYASMYAAVEDQGFKIPAVPWEKIDDRFLRQMVDNTTGEPSGTLVVDISQHLIYYTLNYGKAMRYGVGLGREGFEWSGNGIIKRKAQWPKWHPPVEMIERDPKLKKYETFYDKKTDTYTGGMDGGPSNPLGARAMYIYKDDVDTLFRVHGSPEWNSIGKSVSSGCVRMINQDVIDLHRRVNEGTPIVVR